MLFAYFSIKVSRLSRRGARGQYPQADARSKKRAVRPLRRGRAGRGAGRAGGAPGGRWRKDDGGAGQGRRADRRGAREAVPKNAGDFCAKRQKWGGAFESPFFWTFVLVYLSTWIGPIKKRWVAKRRPAATGQKKRPGGPWGGRNVDLTPSCGERQVAAAQKAVSGRKK